MYSAENLVNLRKEMEAQNLDGFIIPMADRFQGEYLPDCAKRIEYISGFTGSYGVVVVLKDKAAFFTDGRYTIQAKEQVDAELFEIYSISPNQEPTPTLKPEEWIKDNLGDEKRFAVDAWLHTEFQVNKIKWEVECLDGQVVYVSDNPLDKIWLDRPAEPKGKVFNHPLEFAGKSSADKIKDVVDMISGRADILPITSADNICWLLNIRGEDIPYNPFVLSYALVHAEGRVEWFVDKSKLTIDVEDTLAPNVEVKGFAEFEKALIDYARADKSFWLDANNTPMAVKLMVQTNGGEVQEASNPVILMQAQKNEVEIKGAINAHIRDGASVCKFLSELDDKMELESLDELSAQELLFNLRKDNEYFKDLSFATISGAGSNGAIVHYQSSEATNKPLSKGALYLVDSGAQYLDGTTDITRTIPTGEITDEIKDRFTRVLKGHIQVALAEFSEGTYGDEIDALARAPLNEIGEDYAHGTGHGVGSYLAVHEGPCRISSLRGNVPLTEGVILSNEPGFYKEGEYGVRIENLVYIADTGRRDEEDKKILCFKTLTLAPISRELIDVALLGEDELDWINEYHYRVKTELLDALTNSPKVIEFLEKACAPL